MNRSKIVTVLAAFGVLAGGCSSQAEPSYEGEPLAVLDGAVFRPSLSGATPDTKIEAALLWQDVSLLPAAFIGGISNRVAAKGDFPASFELKIFTPPPHAVLGLFPPADGTFPTTPNVGRAQIVAVRADAGADPSPSDILGVDTRHGVLYLDIDAAPGSPEAFWASAFHVPPTRGYHVYAFTETTDARASFDRCRYAGICDVLKMDPSAPSYTWGVDYGNWNKANCLALYPSAEVCEWEAFKDSPCRQRMASMRGSGVCASPRTYADDPGASKSLAITLGTPIWEGMY